MGNPSFEDVSSFKNDGFPIAMLVYQRVPELVGVFNPFEKYARQIGSSPPIFGVKIKKIFELQPPRESGIFHVPIWGGISCQRFSCRFVTARGREETRLNLRHFDARVDVPGVQKCDLF